MIAVNRAPATALCCPECGWGWPAAPRPSVPSLHLQPIRYRCPNTRCRQQHWLIVYRMEYSPLRLEVVDVVRCYGSVPEALERSLRQIKGIGEGELKAMVQMMALQPELAQR